MSRKTPTPLAIAESAFTIGYWLTMFFGMDDTVEPSEHEEDEEQVNVSDETSG